MQIRIRRPVPIDEPLVITASITSKTTRLIETKATVSATDGTLMAESTATMFIVNKKQKNTGQGQP